MPLVEGYECLILAVPQILEVSDGGVEQKLHRGEDLVVVTGRLDEHQPAAGG